MAKPLALVVSDLHLGEASSVLHYGRRFAKGEHPLVNTLVASIRREAIAGSIPFLILAGDVLDFSLAPVQDALGDFRLFLEDVHELFDSIVYIPGNHDHHIWRTLQEQVLVVNRIRERAEIGEFPQEQIGTIADGTIVLNGVDSTKQLGARTFLNDLLPPGAKQKHFAVTYPNLFLKFEQPERDILITHGHFFEVAWTLVSDIFKRSLNLTTMNYQILERINSPVTEFGWYGLGQAGRLSHFIEELYTELKNSEEEKLSLALYDLEAYLDEVWTFRPSRRKGFCSGIRELFSGLGANIQEELSDYGLRLMTRLIKRFIVSQVEERRPYTGGSPLRHCPHILDDAGKTARIQRYLSYSLGRRYGFKPHRLIFGHTHIPIRRGSITMAVNGRRWDIAAFNTGGWVVDSTAPEEIIESRPMPLLVSSEGEIEPVDFPWPAEEEQLGNRNVAEIIEVIQRQAW
jgi:hypothetical protein